MSDQTSLKGHLLTERDDHHVYARIQPTPAKGRTINDEDVADWLSRFPAGSRVTITVEPPNTESETA